MPIPLETLLEEAKCLCAAGGSTSERAIMALLQRIAEAGGGGGGGTPGGAASSVQFNDAGAFGGFGSFNSGTSVLTIPGDLLFNTDNADDIGASGASRPRTGYFGTSVVTPFLDVLSGTIVASSPAIEVTQTWNNAGVTFTGVDINITNTASAAASSLFTVRLGASSRLTVTASEVFANTNIRGAANIIAPGNFVILSDTGSLVLGTANDVWLMRDAAQTFAQRNGASAQVFRVYRTFTNSTNYERLALQSAANEMILAAETAGTGGDNIDLGLTAAGTGRVKINTALNTAVDGGLTAAFTANMVGSTGGPATAAQNGWLLLKDSAGANIWVPVWK